MIALNENISFFYKECPSVEILNESVFLWIVFQRINETATNLLKLEDKLLIQYACRVGQET